MQFNRISYTYLYSIIFVLLGTILIQAQTLEEKQWIAAGNGYYLSKDFEKARVEYSKAVTKSPSWYKANFNLGNAYYELKQYNKAIAHFEKSAKTGKLKVEKANAYHNLGNTYMQLKKFAKAVEAYKSALRNNPKDNETRYNFVMAKKLLDTQDKNQNPPDLPKPSAYAKKMKAKADSLSIDGKFNVALSLMNQAMKKDSTVAHYGDYINKLTEVTILDTIQLK